MKNIIIVTGGAGFVGSNLIRFLLKKTKKKIVSLDNYSSGSKKNHILSKKVTYISGNTFEIEKKFQNIKIKSTQFFILVNLQEFIKVSKKFDECYKSNSIGTNAVFNIALENKIKLIYSATSATLGNSGKDKNLSPCRFY